MTCQDFSMNMVDQEPEGESPHGTTRRNFLLRAAGLTVATLALGSGIRAHADQGKWEHGWRQCSKCTSLFYDGWQDKGHCPAGGGHTAVYGYDYGLLHDSKWLSHEEGWRHCKHCRALFYDYPYADEGRCPSDPYGHTGFGYNFQIRYYTDEHGVHGQPEWRQCDKCYDLFYAGGEGHGQCPAGGGHKPKARSYGPRNYCLLYREDNAPPPQPAPEQKPPPAAPVAVSMKGALFNPARVNVKVGTTVTWTNEDRYDHTVTEDNRAFNSPYLGKGQTFSHTFSKAGFFRYHCEPHPHMTGEVVVE